MDGIQFVKHPRSVWPSWLWIVPVQIPTRQVTSIFQIPSSEFQLLGKIPKASWTSLTTSVTITTPCPPPPHTHTQRKHKQMIRKRKKSCTKKSRVKKIEILQLCGKTLECWDSVNFAESINLCLKLFRICLKDVETPKSLKK